MSTFEMECARAKWFHSIDFGDFASSGRFPPRTPQNRTLFGFMDLVQFIDLNGATVLDIGATDGLASFGMHALGATVHATDSVDKQTFRRGREVLGLHDIKYHPNTQIKDLTAIFPRGTFDLILCAGVFYHMLNPVSAFLECRKIIKDGGLLFVETPYYPNEERAAIFLNSETEMVPEAYTYSVPTKSALYGIAKLASFDVLAARTISEPDRITVLAQAVPPDLVRNRTALTKRIHEVDFCDFEFKLKDHLPPPGLSTINYTGAAGEASINVNKYQSKFPYHPNALKRTVGGTIWSTDRGNR